MSQWTYRTSSLTSAGNGTGDALSVPRPVGAASGDLILVGCYWETDTNTVTASDSLASARRQVNTGIFMQELFWKVAGGSEPANYTLTPGTNGRWRIALAAAYQNGTGTGNRVDVGGGSEADGVAIGSQTAPSVTTTGVDRLLAFLYCNYSGVDATTLTGAVTTLRGSLGGLCLGDAAIAAAGATGTSRPSAGPGTEDYAAQHVALISDIASSALSLIIKQNQFMHMLVRRMPNRDKDWEMRNGLHVPRLSGLE